MDAETLAAVWGKDLRRFPRRAVEASPLNETTRTFLADVGLPHSAAPFLSFGRVYSATSDSEVYLPTLRAAFDLDESELDRFILIGADGADDPIAIDRETDEVVWLVEEEDGGAVRYVNQSVEHLARCLLAYRSFVAEVTARDEMAYLERRYTDAQVERLEAALRQADAQAVNEGAMWAVELATLRADDAELDSN